MASNDTEEQLKNLDKETIIRLFLAQKEQLENLDHTLQLVLEQLADLKRHRLEGVQNAMKQTGRFSLWRLTEISYFLMRRKPLL